MVMNTGATNHKKSHLIKFSIFGTIFLVAAYSILVFDPLEKIVNHKLSVFDGSFLYNLWKKPPLDVFVKVYLFNITNAAAFIAGIDKKLKVEEIGPYVYQEYLENKNPVFNDNGTLSFNPTRIQRFVPERSVGDPLNDIIYCPNIPLLGAASLAHEISYIAAALLGSLASTYRSKTILTLTVHDYLWGYEDKMISLASKYVPKITFEKFGLLDRMFDDGENIVSINLPESVKNIQKKREEAKREKESEDESPLSEYFKDENDDNLATFSRKKRFSFFGSYQEKLELEEDFEPQIRDYSIDMWNGNKGLDHWGYGDRNRKPCNTLSGSYDGTLFPQNISQNEIFNVYRKPFCRTLPIKFSHAGRLWGLDGYFFRLADDAFESDINDPKSSCYCDNHKCMKKGLGNITPCYYNIPAAVSLPHFYKSDPSLLKDIDGLNPDPEKHETEIVIQPRLGVPIKVNIRAQINLVMGETSLMADAKPFNNIVVPIMWVEMAIEKLTPNLEFLLQLLFNYAPYIQTGMIVFMAMMGVAFFATGIIAYCLVPKYGAYGSNYPKNDVRYSAINMLPYIKRGIENPNPKPYSAVNILPYLMRELEKLEDKKTVLNEKIDEESDTSSSGEAEVLDDNFEVRTEIANIA